MNKIDILKIIGHHTIIYKLDLIEILIEKGENKFTIESALSILEDGGYINIHVTNYKINYSLTNKGLNQINQ